MRLFASLSLAAAVLFWTHPLYATYLTKSYRSWINGVTHSAEAPIIVRNPIQGQGSPR